MSQQSVPVCEGRGRCTFFRQEGDRRVHVCRAENAADQARHGYCEVMHPDPSFAGGRRVKSGTLEVGVRLLVELALVLNLGRDRLVCVDSAKLEIGDVSLKEIAVVIGDAETLERGGSAQLRDESGWPLRTVGASNPHSHAVGRLALQDSSELRSQCPAVADRVEARVEEEVAACEAGERACRNRTSVLRHVAVDDRQTRTKSGSVDVLRGEEEEVDSDAGLDALLGRNSVERVLRAEERLLLVGAVELVVLAVFERAKADGWQGRLEDVELTADALQSEHRRFERAGHGGFDDARFCGQAGQAVEQALDGGSRFERVDEEAVVEREEHVGDVGNDEHLRLVEAGLRMRSTGEHQ